MALNFNQYAVEGNIFLKDYTKEMDFGSNHDKAGRVLSSVLYALRDIISPEESLQFIAQLPMFLKALYVNGWALKKPNTKIKHMEEFLDLVKTYDGAAAVNDFGYDNELTEQYVDSTFVYLRKYVSWGEMEDIKGQLPKDLKTMIQSKLMF